MGLRLFLVAPRERKKGVGGEAINGVKYMCFRE
jgi:hypothetical protein